MNNTQNRTLEITGIEARLIIKELEALAGDGVFDDYDTWVELIQAMRNAGFSIDDAQTVSWKDEKTRRRSPRYGVKRQGERTG